MREGMPGPRRSSSRARKSGRDDLSPGRLGLSSPRLPPRRGRDPFCPLRGYFPLMGPMGNMVRPYISFSSSAMAR